MAAMIAIGLLIVSAVAAARRRRREHRPGRGSGFLALDVTRQDASRLRIEVEVANFYPAIAAGLSMPVYRITQAFVHVLVTHAFLRSLATLELQESKVGHLAGETRWPD